MSRSRLVVAHGRTDVADFFPRLGAGEPSEHRGMFAYLDGDATLGIRAGRRGSARARASRRQCRRPRDVWTALRAVVPVSTAGLGHRFISFWPSRIGAHALLSPAPLTPSPASSIYVASRAPEPARLRLTNFNVETFCHPSRTALLTGRYGIRSGTLAYRLPVTGMTLWEITIAEYLKPLGYSTALFGKWHAGNAADRAPTNQGFDEWDGIRDSSNESQRSTFNDTPYIWEGKTGEPSRPVKEFNLETGDRWTARLQPPGESSQTPSGDFIRSAASRPASRGRRPRPLRAPDTARSAAIFRRSLDSSSNSSMRRPTRA